MAYNRIPTIDPFIMRLIPNDSNSTEKTEIQLFTMKQIKKKKIQVLKHQKRKNFSLPKTLKKKKKY